MSNSIENQDLAFLSFSSLVNKRREASVNFDSKLKRSISNSNLLPCINCFYEVLDNAASKGLVAGLQSMRKVGHPVRLWTYTPERLEFLNSLGVELKDANEVVPKAIFDRVLLKAEVRYFSDLFRYALLYELGGLWMDTDIVLIRSFPYTGDYFFNLQWTPHTGRYSLCGNVIVAPPRSIHFRRLFEQSLDCLEGVGTHRFGDIGPKLLSEYVFSDSAVDLHQYVFSPVCFNSIDYTEVEHFSRPITDLEEFLCDERIYGVHLWNKITNSKEENDDNSFLNILLNARETLPNFIELAEKFNTDKNSSVGNRHFYSRIYQNILGHRRFATKGLLEIGLCRGRHENWEQNEIPSVSLWQIFFPFCHIIGLDLTDFSKFHSSRFFSYVCDQSDPLQIARVAGLLKPGSLDVIIDDGSHASYDQQISFRSFFPLLAPGGYYFIEDLDWQPTAENNERVALTKHLFAALRDGLIGKFPDFANISELVNDMDEICFFDSHSELSKYGKRGGLLAVRRRA